MTKTNSIRELQAQKEALLRQYHEQAAAIDAEIAAIRKSRGTKLRTYDMNDYYEEGRSIFIRDPRL